jgi:phosphate transport system substrate-binding protein
MDTAHWMRMVVAVVFSIGPPTNAAWAQNREIAAAVSLRGAGATLPAPLYKKWGTVYQASHPKAVIVYDAVGSGEGIKRFLSETVDFVGSDEFLSAEDAAKVEKGAATIPTTAGMIVLAYNIPGLTGEIRLPRDVYADIFAGRISRWSDARINSANPSIHFPARDIAVVARLDSSGTTAAFTRHLAAADPTWRTRGLGTGKLIAWPAATMLAAGNEGVAARIKISQGSIGYVEYGFAKRLGLPMAALQNKAGEFVAPSEAAAQLALSARVAQVNELERSIVDPPTPGAYPILSYSWLFLYRHYGDRAKAETIRDFVKWRITEGQHYAPELGYIPLSADVVSLGREVLDTGVN